jgi:hypothetical protein
MEQKAIVLSLHMKVIGLDAVHEDLVRTLEKDAVVYSTVTKYVRNARFAPKTEEITPELAENRHDPVDEAILAALENIYFPLCESCGGSLAFRVPLCIGT